MHLLWFVFVVGALGAYIHAAASFANFTGNRQLVSSWTWWYFLHPWIGGALAVLTIFLFRIGLTGTPSSVDSSSALAIAACAGLVGLFSEQATHKLSDVFDVIFKSSDTQKNKLTPSEPPAPLAPAIDSVALSADKKTITVTGKNFVQNSQVYVGSDKLVTQFVSATQLTAALDGKGKTGDQVTVHNPKPDGTDSVSNAKGFPDQSG